MHRELEVSSMASVVVMHSASSWQIAFLDKNNCFQHIQRYNRQNGEFGERRATTLSRLQFRQSSYCLLLDHKYSLQVVSRRLPPNQETISKTGYSYGYGFVNYKNPQDAALAIQKLNGLQVENKKIKVAYALPCSREELVDNNLYIRRLPRDITEEKLQELFGQFGNITQKKLLKDSLTGLNRGVGFVRFSKRSEAQAAIEALHDKVPPGGTERMSVRVASDQKKQNMAFYAGFLESQKYIKDDFDSNHKNSSPTFKAPISSSSKLLHQNARQVMSSYGTRLPGPYFSYPNQNVAFRQRGPLIAGHQRPMFPGPNQTNGNFPHRATRSGFVRNIYQIGPVPSQSVNPCMKSRFPSPRRQNQSVPLRLNHINY